MTGLYYGLFSVYVAFQPFCLVVAWLWLQELNSSKDLVSWIVEVEAF